jgi:hypothetical protein
MPICASRFLLEAAYLLCPDLFSGQIKPVNAKGQSWAYRLSENNVSVRRLDHRQLLSQKGSETAGKN